MSFFSSHALTLDAFVDFQAGYDADVVALLRSELGAHVLGKTNMDEFGMGSFGINSAFGATLNPCSPQEGHAAQSHVRVAGGSSAGSAAAVAANLVGLAVGSDTGGSVRLPASYCGVYGFKPSYGRISRHGLIAYASSLDTVGLLARNLDTLEQAFTAVACTPAALRLGAQHDMTFRGRVKVAAGSSRSSIRIGIPAVFLERHVPAATLQVFKVFLAVLADAPSVQLVPVALPSLKAALGAYYVLSSVEAASCLARYDGLRTRRHGAIPDPKAYLETRLDNRAHLLGHEVQQRLALGSHLACRQADHRQQSLYHRATAIRHALTHEINDCFERLQLDVLLSLTAPSEAPLLHRLVKRASQACSLVTPVPSVVASDLQNGAAGPGVEGTLRVEGALSVEGAQRVEALARTLEHLMSSNDDLDFALRSMDHYVHDLLTVPANLTRIPAISLPWLTGPAGWPLGIQLMAPYMHDEELLLIVRRLQSHLPPSTSS